jgi:hypothetical protein
MSLLTGSCLIQFLRQPFKSEPSHLAHDGPKSFAVYGVQRGVLGGGRRLRCVRVPRFLAADEEGKYGKAHQTCLKHSSLIHHAGFLLIPAPSAQAYL